MIKPTLFEYKGHALREDDWDRGQGQAETIQHICVMPDGSEVWMDFTQYRSISEDCFRKWVDLGCPNRSIIPGKISALYEDEIHDLHARQVAA